MKKYKRPIDNYDTAAWEAYYSQFPNARRSVGADGDDDDVDLSKDPKVQELIKTAVASAVAETTVGLKKNSDTLIEENRALKRQFEGVDIEGYNSWQERMANDEELKLIAEGKTDEVVNRRTERMRGDYETRIKTAETKTSEAEENSASWEGRYANEKIGNELRRAAELAQVLPEAMDDVVSRGNGLFKINAEGGIEARDAAGQLLMSKDGKSVLGPKEFVESLKETTPHYWPGSRGAGAGGSGSGSGGLSDIDSAMNMAAQKGDMKEYRRLKLERKKRANG